MNTSSSNTAEKIQKMAEDDVLTLLQRLQRQYHAQGVSGDAGANTSSSARVGMVASGNADGNVRSGGHQAFQQSPKELRMDRPPDAIATALGRQLAQHYQALNVCEIPKGLQEKTLLALCNKKVPTNVLSGFLAKLLQESGPTTASSSSPSSPSSSPNVAPLHGEVESNHDASGTSKSASTPTPNYIQLDWLPQWMVYCEHEYVKSLNQTQSKATSSSIASSFETARRVNKYRNSLRYQSQMSCQQPFLEALTILARAYAQYQSDKLDYLSSAQASGQKIPMMFRNHKNDSQHSRMNSAAQNRLQTGHTIAMTFRQFETDAGRFSFLRECIQIAFRQYAANANDIDDGDEKASMLLRCMISPLLSATVLTPSTSIAASTLCCQEIWRQSWQLVEQTNDLGVLIQKLWHILTWQTKGLDLFLRTVSSCYTTGTIANQHSYTASPVAAKELATQWFHTLLELAVFLQNSILSEAEMEDSVEASAAAAGRDGAKNGGRVGGTKDFQSQHRQRQWQHQRHRRDRNHRDVDYGADYMDGNSDSEKTKTDGISRTLQRSLYLDKCKEWLEHILCTTLLSWFTIVPSYHVSFHSGYQSLLEILAKLSRSSQSTTSSSSPSSLASSSSIKMTDTTFFRLATMALSLPRNDEAMMLVKIISYLSPVPTDKAKTFDTTAPASQSYRTSIFQALKCVLRTNGDKIDPKGNGGHNFITLAASSLLQPVISTVTTNSELSSSRSMKDPNQNIQSIIQFLDDSVVNTEEFLHFVAPASLPDNTEPSMFDINNGIDDDDDIEESAIFPHASILSSIQQNAAFVLGIALSSVDARAATRYWRQMLPVYSHVGIPLLPVWMESINQTCAAQDGALLMKQLDFLCTTLIIDKHCSREVWNLLNSYVLDRKMPITVRTTIIRFFPKLCAANRRLYTRVIDAIGKCLALTKAIAQMDLPEERRIAEIGQISIAVIATLADMAKEGLIRDVSDVIGWVQSFIMAGSTANRFTSSSDETPIHAVLIHFALRCLHYLMLSQELEFSLVMVVLNKHLCDVHDRNQIIRLPLLILEPLVELLGDGGLGDMDHDDDDDDDNDNDENDEDGRGEGSGDGFGRPRGTFDDDHEILANRSRAVRDGDTSQVSKCIETLITLAQSQRLQLHSTMPRNDRTLVNRIRNAIHESLARYSVHALGLNAEGLHRLMTAPAMTTTANGSPNGDGQNGYASDGAKNAMVNANASVAKRYNDLRQIIINGVNSPSSATSKNKSEPDASNSSIAALIVKMMAFEQDSFSANLWHLGGDAANGKRQANAGKANGALDHETDSALPRVAKVQQLYNENSSPTSSVAMLLCFEGKPMTLLNDVALDVRTEERDPLVQSFTVQGWLNAARSLLKDVASAASNSADGYSQANLLESLDSTLQHLRGWRNRHDAPDNALLGLAAVGVFVRDILEADGADCSRQVGSICDDVWEAYDDGDCEDMDSGRVAIALTAIARLHNNDQEGVDRAVNALIRSITDHEGEVTFGAAFGLAIIAQAAYLEFLKDSRPNHVKCAKHIISFLVQLLISLFDEEYSELNDLVDCIKKGRSPDVRRLTALGKQRVRLEKANKTKAKIMFIALAICLPGLAIVNDELLLGVYCMLESIEWGAGKGIAMPSVLRACRQAGLFEARQIEQIYSRYAKVFEDGMEDKFGGLDDVLYAVSATASKTIPDSIRRFLVGNRNLFDEPGRALSIVAATLSIASIPCLGCASESILQTPKLSYSATIKDVKDIVGLIVSGAGTHGWNKYTEICIILTGFMASMDGSIPMLSSGDSVGPESSMEASASDMGMSAMPAPRSGTVLETVITALAGTLTPDSGSTLPKARKVNVEMLLGTLKTLPLPGHFATVLRDIMHSGKQSTKVVCSQLLVSQVRDHHGSGIGGKEFVSLSLQIANTPIASMRGNLGNEDGIKEFIECLSDLVPKIPQGVVAETVDNVWRFCINQIGNHPSWTVSYLAAMEKLMKSMKDSKVSMSPKVCSILRTHVLRRIFAGIRDAPWTAASRVSSTEEQLILESYTDCLEEIPIEVLGKADFFALTGKDGFAGEALRSRCVLGLVQNEYFTTPARASSEIAASITWFCKQLASSEDEIFSSSLLRVACAVAEATSVENDDKRIDILLRLLENYLSIGAAATTVALQMLAALVSKWTEGIGSDGDLSMGCLTVHGMSEWQRLSPPTLQQFFALALHDLPYNFALFCQGEEISESAFSRLLRLYKRWREIGADQATVDCIRNIVTCSRHGDIGEDGFVALGITMLV